MVNPNDTFEEITLRPNTESLWQTRTQTALGRHMG